MVRTMELVLIILFGWGGSVAIVSLIYSVARWYYRWEFMFDHGDQIRKENEEIAARWRASNPREKNLKIKRTLQRPGGPRITIKQRFRSR